LLIDAIEEATGKAKGKVKEITFEQFVEVVDMLQDAMEGMTTDLDDFGDDEDEEESVAPVVIKVGNILLVFYLFLRECNVSIILLLCFFAISLYFCMFTFFICALLAGLHYSCRESIL
jgi:hypothetical protein